VEGSGVYRTVLGGRLVVFDYILFSIIIVNLKPYSQHILTVPLYE
jgi:hypothetical protein